MAGVSLRKAGAFFLAGAILGRTPAAVAALLASGLGLFVLGAVVERTRA